MSGLEITRSFALGGVNAGGNTGEAGKGTTPVLAGRQNVVDGGKQLPQGDDAGASTEAIDAAIAVVESYLQQTSRSLQFSVDDQSGRKIFTVVDSSTGDIVRQVPSEDVLAAARYIAASGGDVTSGTLLNTES